MLIRCLIGGTQKCVHLQHCRMGTSLWMQIKDDVNDQTWKSNDKRALLVESGTPWLDLQHLFPTALTPDCSAEDVFALGFHWVEHHWMGLCVLHVLPGLYLGSFYTDITHADFPLLSHLVFGTAASPQNSSPQEEPSNE